MPSKLDDLTILLNLVDKTKSGFASVQGRMGKLQKAASLMRKSFIGIGAAMKSAFVAGIVNGAQLTSELASMARQTNLTLQEAHALFTAVADADDSTTIDNLNEALLSVKERFADAAVGAGPLFGLLNDFRGAGFDLNLGVDNATDQLANFLEQVGNLPTANDRIFALKEVLGDEDARPFFNVINNTKELNSLLMDLRANIEDLPDVFTIEDQVRIENVKRSSKELGNEWKQLSIELFALYAPLLELANKIAIKTVQIGRAIAGGLGNVRDGLSRLIGREPLGPAVELTDDARERVGRGALAEDPRLKPKETKYLINEYGVFETPAEFTRFLAEQRAATDAAVASEPIRIERPEVKSLEDGQRERLFLADSLRDKEAEAAAFRMDLREQEVKSIFGISSALRNAGTAFGTFAQLAEGKSQSIFKNFKRLQVGLSLVAGIAAQIGVLVSPDTVLFSQKLAAYFRIGTLVAGSLAQLKAINLSGSGGGTTTRGGSSGAGSAGSAASSGRTAAESALNNQNDAPTRNVTVNIRGEGRYTAESIEELIEAINSFDTSQRIQANRLAS